MKRKQYLLLVALTVVAGLIGGAVSNCVFVTRSAIAQETEYHKKVVTAEEFRLVDKSGNVYAVLGKKVKEPIRFSEEFQLSPVSSCLWLYDKDGNERANFSVVDYNKFGLGPGAKLRLGSDSNGLLLMEKGIYLFYEENVVQINHAGIIIVDR